MEYASNGKANAALATGIVGTVLGVTNGGMGLLSGLTGNAGCNANCQGGSQMVNRYEMELIQQNTAKDSEIALLKADKYTDEKIVESYKDLQGQIKELSAEVRSNKEEQSQINMNQAVYNGTKVLFLAFSSRLHSCRVLQNLLFQIPLFVRDGVM